MTNPQKYKLRVNCYIVAINNIVLLFEEEVSQAQRCDGGVVSSVFNRLLLSLATVCNPTYFRAMNILVQLWQEGVNGTIHPDLGATSILLLMFYVIYERLIELGSARLEWCLAPGKRQVGSLSVAMVVVVT